MKPESGSIPRIVISNYKVADKFVEARTHYLTATLEEKEWWLWWCFGPPKLLPCGCRSHKHWGPGIDPCAGPMLPW